jgi:predicted transposase YbfD/YdcC
MKYADIDMNISTQALLVLRALSRQDIPDDWDVTTLETSAWYNGRERGVCVTFRHKKSKYLAITFGECRNSDSIFIDHFDIKCNLNPPTIADFSEDAYGKRRYADYLGISDAIDIITNILRDWSHKADA